MVWKSKTLSTWFQNKETYKLLKKSGHGIERECLRVDPAGKISKKTHPESLGSTLCNPYITTDFGEAQLELISPVFRSEKGVLKFLENLHTFILKNLNGEMIWASSIPCAYQTAEEIRLAEYGETEAGRLKHLYRQGLSHRYGRIMQTLSGVHYNFSFSPLLIEALRDSFKKEASINTFRTDLYFHICRNFLRYGWLNTYLFGTTPACDLSYLPKPHPALISHKNSYIGEEATSIRMSELGYYSKVQTQIAISYNTLSEFLSDMERALTKPYPPFESIGLFGPEGAKQINTSILQLPAEHYSRIRPKPKNGKNGYPITALREKGIEYVEARAVDINPFSPDGIDLEQMRFLHIFFLFCLLEESPPLSFEEEKMLTHNQNNVALYGRKKNLAIQRGDGSLRPLSEEGGGLLEKMEAAALLLDLNFSNFPYLKSLRKQNEKLLNPSKTPSALIFKNLLSSGKSFQDFAFDLTLQHASTIKNRSLSPSLEKKLVLAAKKSLEEKKEKERKEDFLLPGYEHLELSTQMILREARKRGVEATLIDEKDHLLLLKKGNQKEYVKQATITSKDNLISYFLMENKHVTKKLMKENGLPIPEGDIFDSFSKAMAAFPDFQNKKLVVKPSHTNFGLGIHFIEKGDAIAFEMALKEGFSLGSRVIVEEFIPGLEYRFLVIGNQVSAVCRRLPANVIGNGIDSIRTLVKKKNSDPKKYKYPKYRIRLGKMEIGFLKKQGLTPEAIPKDGERIFLRENSNVSTGGDPVDKTDSVHPAFKELALKATQVVGANFCGLDLMIQDPEKPPHQTPHAIIELNFNPAIFLHRYPVEGRSIKVEEAVLDLLGF